MKYIKYKDKIVFFDKSDFNPTHILECGQVFTYEQNSNGFIVFSEDKMAKVIELENRVEILTNEPDYFEEYFDLKTSYFEIKARLIELRPEMKEIIAFGSGIRILKQGLLETLVGFIISANNNIGRIRKSMKYLRERLGQNMGDYFAFPTLKALQSQTFEFYVEAGLGYRAKQIVKAFEQLENIDLKALEALPTAQLKTALMAINGVGSKVADCVLLFGYGRGDVFPVDTWIEKIYHEYFDKTELNRETMREKLVKGFGELSGYAQQYFFYYKRSAS